MKNKPRRRPVLAWLPMLLAAAACLSSAQTINLSGTVVAPDSTPVAGCQVILTSGGTSDTVVTGAGGLFSFASTGVSGGGHNALLPAGSFLKGNMLCFNTGGGTQQVSIDVMDVRGGKVGAAFNGTLSSGSYGLYPLACVSSRLPDGLYIIRVRIGRYMAAHKLIGLGRALEPRSLFHLSGGVTSRGPGRQAAVQADTAVLTFRHPQYAVKSMQVYNLSAGNLGLVVLSRLPVATVRIQNNTKYDMISIRLNNVEQLASGYILAVGASWDLTFTSGGTVSYLIRVGLMDAYGATTEYFNYSGSVTAVVGQVATINCVNPTLAQLLAGFAASRNWVGYYYDANLGMHYAAYTIFSGGSYTLRDNTNYDGTGGTQIGSGTLTLVGWPDRATIIQFRLGTAETINIAYPFASFQQRNGPASWPIIQYTAR